MRASLRLLLVAGLASLAATSACATDGGNADDDTGGGDDDIGEAPDARRNTDFRDAADCPGAGSGGSGGSGSGTGSGSGGCGEVAPPDATPCDVHTFTYAGAATSVWVTGSFTDWATTPPGALAMTDAGGGAWSVTAQIGEGRQSYKLILDGATWIVDPANPDRESDGFGGQNSVVTTCSEAP